MKTHGKYVPASGWSTIEEEKEAKHRPKKSPKDLQEALGYPRELLQTTHERSQSNLGRKARDAKGAAVRG
jgi:hypothetical protein